MNLAIDLYIYVYPSIETNSISIVICAVESLFRLLEDSCFNICLIGFISQIYKK